jgi:hypothetical protein
MEGVGLAWAYLVYERMRGQATGSPGAALAHAHQIVNIERFVGINAERDAQQLFVHVAWFMTALRFWYGVVYFVAPITVLVLLYRRMPARYVRWRNALLLMFVLALVVYWLYPLMPPRLMPHSYGFVQTSRDALDISGHVRTFLGASPSPSKANFDQYGNAFAALPSFHFASSLWVVGALWPLVRRRWRALLACYPLTMLLCIIVTANHWFLDGAASCVVVAAACAGAGALASLRHGARSDDYVLETRA